MKVAKSTSQSPNQLAADGLVNHTVDANSFLSYFQSILVPEQPLWSPSNKHPPRSVG